MIVIVCWDEIAGEAGEYYKNNNEDLQIAQDATDQEVIDYVDECLGGKDEEYWTHENYSRTKNALVIEWRNTDNDLAVTTLIWY